MKRMQLTVIAASLALTTVAWAQTATVTATSSTPVVSSSTSSYLKRTAPRFESFAGSSDNYSSLAGGLRSGTPIVLTGSGEKVAFNAPTKPMGYGNVTRALDLAQRQLAAQGITNPTPTQLQAALTGGTIVGPRSTVTYAGVLQQRASGMGWGQIAHSNNLHPGMGKSASSKLPAPSASGITSAAGGRVTASGKVNKSASAGATGKEHARVSSAAGGNAAIPGSGRGHGASAGVSSAAGASAGGGGGHGHGNAGGGGGRGK